MNRAERTGEPTVDHGYSAETVRLFQEKGWWHDKPLTDYLDEWAASTPDRVFVSDGVHDLSYAEVRGQAYRLGTALRAMGVRAGDRVVVQLPNWAEFVVTYLAIARIGAITVPIMPVHRQAEVGYVLKNSQAVVAVTAGIFRKFNYQQMFRELRADCPDLQNVIIVRGEPADGELSFAELTEGDRTPSAELLGAPPAADSGHVIVYTSGTESRSKGCFHSWNTIGFSVRGLSLEIMQLTTDDVVFMPSPITHSTGLVVGVGVPLVAGAGIHLLDIWEPEEGLRRIGEYRCTVTATATTFVRMLLDAYDPQRHDVSSLRFWLCAGAPIPPSLADQVAERLPGCALRPLYGSSEIMAGTCCRLDAPADAITGSDGRAALDGVEIKTIDQKGNVVRSGEEGEVCYRGPGRMHGYWRDPERTAAAVDCDGWYHTSDLGQLREDGYLRITGRLKDIIIRGGTNISAREIEDHLLDHPKVVDVAVVAVPDERLGEKAFAFVRPANGSQPTLTELADYLRVEKRISVQKLPEYLELIDEFPVTATGKTQKFELRKMAKAKIEQKRVTQVST